jgi:hypothetical protein
LGGGAGTVRIAFLLNAQCALKIFGRQFVGFDQNFPEQLRQNHIRLKETET